MIKVVSALLIMCFIVVACTGCGGTDVKTNAYRSIATALVPTQALAANSDYELNWDEDAKAVIYKSLEDGSYWSDILYEKFLEGSESANGNSPISITVANTKTLEWNTFTSHEQLAENGSIACKKIDNGIRVTYFFHKYKIAVPVEYVLREDSLAVSIDGRNILEDGTDYKLVSVTLTPNLCSLKNDTENGYLFVPTGCGALMNTAETPEGVRTYTGEVYGDDGARQVPYDFADDESVRLPIFGASGGGKAMLGIIESGAGSAEIEAQAGNNRLGYSNIGAKFYVRGYDRFFFTYHGKPQGTTSRVNDNIAKVKMTVGFYPLHGEKANYAGMAEKYREYLKNNKMLTNSKLSDSPYSITVLGGTGITKSILGIPKKEIKALTTFNRTAEIISELSKENNAEPTVRLVGFGDKGVRPGSIAGGSGFLSIYGSKKDLENLMDVFPNTFMDFDIVSFAKSGNGFSLSFDVSKTAIKYKAEHFAITPNRVMDEENAYYIIARDVLSKAGDKAIKKADKYGIRSVSLSTLGSIAFSDYSREEYINKNGIEKDVTALLKKVQKNKKAVAVSNANSYAAGISDVIFDVASTCGDYVDFDVEIPFYQMVFHSYKNLYSESVNMAENSASAFAKAMAYGMGASFTLTDRYVADSDDLDEYPLYGTVYEDNKDMIHSFVCKNGFMNIYKQINDAAFLDYKILENGVSESTFDNGIKLYVNLTESVQTSPQGELQPYTFAIG